MRPARRRRGVRRAPVRGAGTTPIWFIRTGTAGPAAPAGRPRLLEQQAPGRGPCSPGRRSRRSPRRCRTSGRTRTSSPSRSSRSMKARRSTISSFRRRCGARRPPGQGRPAQPRRRPAPRPAERRSAVPDRLPTPVPRRARRFCRAAGHGRVEPLEEIGGRSRRHAATQGRQTAHRVRPERIVVGERRGDAAQVRTGRHEPCEQAHRFGVAARGDEAAGRARRSSPRRAAPWRARRRPQRTHPGSRDSDTDSLRR